MKNNYFKISEQSDIVTVLWISFVSGLIEDNWILASASTFNLPGYNAFVQYVEKNLASNSYAAGKGRSILLIFSDNCGYSLTPHQNSTSSFFKG